MANKDTKQLAKKGTETPVTVVTMDDVRDKVIILREEPVLVDSDVAQLYGVQTKEINQAVKNNPRKFPYGYVMALDEYEKRELVKNFDRFNMLKQMFNLKSALLTLTLLTLGVGQM